MLKLLIFRFWPVFIPIIVYWLWHQTVMRKAVKAGKPAPLFRDGPWYWLLLASLAMGVLCFVLWSASAEKIKGHYIPPHMENGVLVPGHVESQP